MEHNAAEIAAFIVCCGDPVIHSPVAVQATASNGSARVEHLAQEEGYVATRGAIVYCRSIGAGSPLVLLHGGPGQSHDYFLPGILRIARNHRLVLLDERGCGRSQRLSKLADYNLDAMADDIEDLRQALDLGKIDLLGHSVGGILAQAYATRYQSSLRRLILVGTVVNAVQAEARLREILLAEPPEVREKLAQLEAEGIFDADSAFKEEYQRVSAPIIGKYNHVRPRAPRSGSIYSELSVDVYQAMWGNESDYRISGNMKGFDFSEGMRHLRVPALVVYGDHDILPKGPATRLHELISGSELVEIPRSGHMVFDDNPDSFADAVLRFIGDE